MLLNIACIYTYIPLWGCIHIGPTSNGCTSRDLFTITSSASSHHSQAKFLRYHPSSFHANYLFTISNDPRGLGAQISLEPPLGESWSSSEGTVCLVMVPVDAIVGESSDSEAITRIF